MQARAHLKLIISEPQDDSADSEQQRMSMVQPVSNMRLWAQWLHVHASVLALWSVAAVLLSVAGLLLVSRL